MSKGEAQALPEAAARFAQEDDYARVGAWPAALERLTAAMWQCPSSWGWTAPQYTQSELDAFRKENAQGVTWEGRHMTGYEATQYQNRIERGIRTQKHRVLMSEAAGDGEQLLHDRVKLTRLNQEYARFNKAMGFKSRAERLEVVGWSSSRTTQKQVGSIKNDPQRFREIDFEDKPVTKESIARIKPVSSQLLDATG